METLTIQQLAPYLPYGLKLWQHISETPIDCIGFQKDSVLIRETDENVYHSMPFAFKPILYPISCLTKPIEHNGETFVPKEKLREISGAIEPCKDLKNTFDIKISEGKVIGFSALCMYIDQYALFQKLAEWHINFNGIPEGLYIDKQTLKDKL